jgi:Fe-S-cluster containining protein
MNKAEAGIKFECKKCGQCCKNTSPDMTVPLYVKEIGNIADYLGLSKAAFIDKYCNLVHDKYIFRDCTITEPGIELKKGPDNGSCVFLKDNLCRIHAVRPFLCEIGPFNIEFMSNIKEYKKFQSYCCGFGKGEVIEMSDIQRQLELEEEYDECYQTELNEDEWLMNIFNSSKVAERETVLEQSYEKYLKSCDENIKTVFGKPLK